MAVFPSLLILAQLTLDLAQLIEKLETTLNLVDVGWSGLVRKEVFELAIEFLFLLQQPGSLFGSQCHSVTCSQSCPRG